MKTGDSIQQKSDYGQDMPGIIITSAVLSVVMLALSYWQLTTYAETDSTQPFIIGTALAVLGVFLLTTSLAGIWSSRKGKLILRDKVMSLLRFKGNETVLDLGCGKGLLLIEAAKRLPEGKAIGADLWDKTLEYSYTAQMAINNAAIEGVADRVEVVTADAQSMPFANETFDVVMTSLMMHHVPDTQKAISEMIRVLKPGGKLVIADVNSKRFIPLFKRAGLKKVENHYATRLFFVPAKIVTGVKS
jgi:ubiquinone/menaquinone biosynthesis C-methylase UbiE